MTLNQTKSSSNFMVLSILSGLGFLLLLEAMALWLTGGRFEYPLDDVYIHLAMAEGIRAGGYGVNPGEYASAASSALYPFLLLPVFPPEIQRIVPMFWNVVGLVASAVLWAKLLIAGGYGSDRLRPIGLGLAIAGPIALLMSSTAFLGMEHTLHTAASLAILLGLVRLIQGSPNWTLLFAGIFLSPILRYEGLALALLACGVLFISGHRGRAGVGMVLAVLPLAMFSGYLMSLGLDPLPNSIQAKQLIAAKADANMLQSLIAKFRNNISNGGGAILLGFVLALWAALVASKTVRSGPYRLLTMVLIVAGAGHLFLGQIGWMNRYEHYILTVLVAGLLLVVGSVSDRLSKPALAAIAALAMGIPSMWYLPEVVGHFPIGPRAVHHQQGQMSVFVKQHLNAPVAVNDIGWLSWDNENYVLDLWGLASAKALHLRLGDTDDGWAGPLAQEHDAVVAMIYQKWLADAVDPSWVRLGDFRLKDWRGFLGGHTVTFYATAPRHVPAALKALDEWVPGLDPLTYFEYTQGPD
ncbi:MAG: hypothetical protein V3U96_04945 [Paracoccaceae bacterium]